MIKKQCLILALSLTAVVGSFTACGNASSTNNAPTESITKLVKINDFSNFQVLENENIPNKNHLSNYVQNQTQKNALPMTIYAFSERIKNSHTIPIFSCNFCN